MSLRVSAVVIANLVGDEIDDGDHGEQRVRAFGLFGTRLFVAVYTMRKQAYRIISVRKATKAEEKKWLR